MCVCLCVVVYLYHIVVYVVPEGHHGCQGGNMYNSFMYIINDGVNSEKSYKYQRMVSYVFIRAAQFKKPMGKCFAQIIRCHLSYL